MTKRVLCMMMTLVLALTAWAQPDVSSMVPLITSASQLSSNCAWTTGLGVANLVDGDQNTYFHSNPNIDMTQGTEFLQISLDVPVGGFYFEMSGRSDGAGTGYSWHDTPDKILVKATNTPDNDDSWVEIGTKEYPIEDVDGVYYLTEEPVMLNGAYKYIRLYILHATSGLPYWNVTEFQMYGYVAEGAEGYITFNRDDYASAWSDIIAGQQNYMDDAIGQASVLNQFQEALNATYDFSSFEEFMDAYASIMNQKAAVVSSVKAYKTYMEKVEYVRNYLDNDQSFTGDGRDLLESYLNDKVEPGDRFTNGSYAYILDNCQLDEAGILAEAEMVQKMLDVAIESGYTAGADISSILTNAELSGGANGWNMTGDINVSDNMATSSNMGIAMQQTLVGLTPGLYEVKVPAAYRANSDDLSLNQCAFVYANNNKVYMSTVREGCLGVDAEIQNIDNFDILQNEEGDTEGYIPTNKAGFAEAFQSGYYSNDIVVEVGQDGRLTIGVSVPGCKAGNNVWIGPFSLYYCGETSSKTALDAMDRAIECQKARLTTLTEHYTCDDYQYAAAPNYPAALTEEAQAALSEEASTADAKLAAIAKMSDLMQNVYDGKQAYVAMFDKAENLMDMASNLLTDNLVTTGEYADIEQAYSVISDAYSQGSYSTQEALAANPFQNLPNTPAIVDGVAQISTPKDLVMFSVMVNSGEYRTLNARLLNDIDMSQITAYCPIGMAKSDEMNHTGQDITNPGYAGTFDGQRHVIRNLTAYTNESYAVSGVFGTVTGTIRMLGIENYYFNNNQEYDGRFGALCGQLVEGTIENCYVTGSTVACTDEICGAIAAGNYGGTVKYCFEANNSIQAYSRAGYLIGDAADDNSVRVGTEINCYSEHSVTGTYASKQQFCEGNISATRFASGEIAYKLNGGMEEGDLAWHQTIYEDQTPTLDSSHLIVRVSENGNYSNFDGVNADLYVLVQEATEVAKQPQVHDHEALITDASQLSSNCAWNSDVDVDHLVDGNPNTHFHSVTNIPLGDGTEYLQVNLNRSVEGFYLEFTGRSDGAGTGNSWHDTPNKIRIEATNTPEKEGSWTIIDTQTYDLENIDGAYYKSTDPIMLNGSYQYLRFYVLSTTSGATYWNLSQFQVYDSVNQGLSQYESDESIREAVDAVTTLCTADLEKAKNGVGTQSDIDELNKALLMLKGRLGILVEGINTELYDLAEQALQFSNSTKQPTPLITSADQMSSNCVWNSDGPEALIDGNHSTYFHSTIDTPLEEGTEYLQVALPNAVESFNFEMLGRSDGANSGYAWHDTPDRMTIKATNTPDDEDSWVEISTQDYPIEDVDGAYYFSPEPVQLGASYQYIRFYVLHSSHDMTYWNLDEFQMYSVGSELYKTNDDVRNAVDALETLCEADKTKAKAGEATQEDIDQLQESLNALKRMLGQMDNTNSQLKELATKAGNYASKIQNGLLIFDTDQFNNNCQWNSSYGTDGLLDGDWMTYFHSRIDTDLSLGTEYLQVDLYSAVSSFYMEFCGRDDGASYHDNPDRIRIKATNTPDDESSWTTITTDSYNVPNEAGTRFKTSEPIQLGSDYQYLRFYVLHSTSDNTYWNISEFQLYAGDMSQTYYGSNSDLRQAADLVASLSAEDLTKVDTNAGTQADLETLTQAYETLKNLFQDCRTGIQQISAEPQQINTQTDKIYTINGIRVEKTTKGLYIINGKKVLVK